MLILASQSPRRRELLAYAGIAFEVRGSGVPELHAAGEDPVAYVRRLARSKAEAIEVRAGEVVLGADTVVVSEGEILEKPFDNDDAARMLRSLSGKTHSVVTGICLRGSGKEIQDHAETFVTFHELTDDEIRLYVGSGEPVDKAGAYAIQGLASKFVRSINGCYANVVGLPVALVYQHLKSFGSVQMSVPV